MKREKLIEFRKKKKLTQREMSELLEITISFYSKIELGVKNPSLKIIKRFKEKFPKANIENIFLSQDIT